MIEQPRRYRRRHAAAARDCAYAVVLRNARMLGDGRVRQRSARCVRGTGAQRGNVRTDVDCSFTASTRSPSAAWRFNVDSTASLP
ncbi:hypothetical protein [Xanthomonas tesorieronis]|uniref:hypothetical protein n=1 Tax=Xanthomonas tesorieronis TaxID=3160839 RepID=UPI0035161917